MAKLTKRELEKIIQEELDYVEEGFLDFFKKKKSEKPSAQKSNPLTDPMAGKLERHTAFSNLLKKHEKPVRMATKNLLDDLFQLDPYFKGLEVTKKIDKEAKNLRGTLKQQIKKIDKSVEKLKSGEADIEEPILPSAQKAAEKEKVAKAYATQGTGYSLTPDQLKKAQAAAEKAEKAKKEKEKEELSKKAKGRRQGKGQPGSNTTQSQADKKNIRNRNRRQRKKQSGKRKESLEKQIFNDIVAILNENKMKEEQ
jgi:hypothetical protein